MMRVRRPGRRASIALCVAVDIIVPYRLCVSYSTRPFAWMESVCSAGGQEGLGDAEGADLRMPSCRRAHLTRRRWQSRREGFGGHRRCGRHACASETGQRWVRRAVAERKYVLAGGPARLLARRDPCKGSCRTTIGGQYRRRIRRVVRSRWRARSCQSKHRRCQCQYPDHRRA